MAAIVPVLLDAWVVALMFALVALAAVTVLSSVTSRAGHNVPGIGGIIGPAIDSFWRGLFVAITPAANASLGALTGTIDRLVWEWGQLTATVGGLADLTFGAAYRIVTVVLPHATGLVLSQAQAGILSARAYALLEVQRAQTAALALFTAAEARAQALYDQGLAVSLGLFHTAEHDAALAVAVAERDALSLAAAERAFTVAGLATAEGYAQSLLANALAQMHAIEAGLLGQLGGVAVADRDALQRQVRDLQQEIKDAAAAVSAAATGSIAAVALDVAAIKALRCIQQCNILGALGDGLALLDVGLIFLLVEAARSNPQATQQFLSAEIAPLLRSNIPPL